MTPAEEIRAAAKKIRDIAAKATPGPWEQEHRGSCIVHCANHTVAESVYLESDAAHIALWHPVVAVAVAELLDAHVIWWERIEEQNSRPGDGRTRVLPNDNEVKALELARAINQGSKP